MPEMQELFGKDFINAAKKWRQKIPEMNGKLERHYKEIKFIKKTQMENFKMKL